MSARLAARGFTIVELLVVAAIMAMLFGIILAGVRPSAGGDVRRTARQIAAVLLSAQSRAIGSRTGAAVLFESDGNPQAADPKNNRAVRVRDAEMAPSITAEVISPFQVPPLPADEVSQNPPFSLDSWVVHIPFVSGPGAQQPIIPENASREDLDAGFRIRFTTRGTPWSPWYGFLPRGEDRNFNGQLDQGEDLAFGPNSPRNGKLDAQSLVVMRYTDGQTADNALWPASLRVPPSPPRYSIEISRYPGLGTTALELPLQVAIDLRYSGHGDEPGPTSTWGYLGSKGVIGLSFNAVGGVDLLMQNVTGVGGPRVVQPLMPMETIYLFVVPRAELESELLAQAGAMSTLASNRAAWIAVEPRTGRVSVAANEPQVIAATASVTRDQLRAARSLARAGRALGN